MKKQKIFNKNKTSHDNSVNHLFFLSEYINLNKSQN